ncbi:hypothetical protein [Candidatus Formimonas warabiya]|uniref:Uncharacterized protein n=1 Tax=Formimonas warabiya TaxID=1761012 RepID=A0A3G1KV97_FORW1|nr:hypothetical protein [Candidatus Formimonas warabiya]ATW26327.1 hypothetical protein DCMF_17550 [Candidatus Formimonas warabiya]
MKKITIVFSLICILILCTVAVYAKEAPKDNDVTLINNAEITDVDQLFLRAKNGITDCDVKPFIKNEKAFLRSQGDSKELQTYSTAQVLKETKKQNGSTEKTIAVTTFVIVPLGGGSYNDEKPDSTGAVVAYSTRYWSTITDSVNNTCYLLTRASGGWRIEDAQVSLSSRKVIYNCNGAGADGGPAVTTQHVTKTPTSNTFSYSTGFTKYVCHGFDLGFSVGVSTEVKLTRGTANWYLFFDNFIS